MRIFAYFLLLGVVLQTCSKQLIYSDYLVNKDFVARVLCINKNAPEKHCEGKCHLKKQLDQDTKQQDGDNQKTKTGAEVVCLSPETMVFVMAQITVSKHYFYYQISSNEKYLSDVFHPPGVLKSC